MSSFEEVDELLSRFDEIQEFVAIKRKKVDRFLGKLGEQLNSFFLNEYILNECHFEVVGSSAEETAVRDSVDFDIIMELPQPFTMDYLCVTDVSECGEMGVYKLHKLSEENGDYSNEYDDYSNEYDDYSNEYDDYSNEYDDYSNEYDDYSNEYDEYSNEYDEYSNEYDDYSNEYDDNPSSSDKSTILNAYTNKNGYLKVKYLKETVFTELEHAVKEIAKVEPNVSYKTGRKQSSFCITVHSTSSSGFKIDLIPQIKGFRENFIEDWNDDVSNVVEDYLLNYTEHTYFSLSFPFWLDEENYEHLAVYATFSQMEGYCMGESDNVRNAVRLTKAVSKHYGWVENGLQSFHIKRASIALFDTLEEMDPWYGYQAILSELQRQLRADVIWGVFLKDHNIALKDTNTCRQLAEDIALAKQNICPSNILKKLSVYF